MAQESATEGKIHIHAFAQREGTPKPTGDIIVIYTTAIFGGYCPPVTLSISIIGEDGVLLFKDRRSPAQVTEMLSTVYRPILRYGV